MANVLISTALSVGVGLLQRAMTPDTKTKTEGTRLTNSQITGASEGTSIPRIYRRFRVGGQIIWATTFREVVTTTKTKKRSGKGGGPRTVNETTTYQYFCSFAVGICEGEAGVSMRRVYLDGTEVDMSTINHRFYSGDASQNPDPKIVAVEGAGNVPAYRGLCYLVFDELDLTNYGNRIPQISVEVVRLVPATDPSSLRHIMRSVQLIPSCGEFILATEPVTRTLPYGESDVVNIHTASGGGTDIVVSLDQLQEEAPAVDSISLVVAWFGDTLSATTCQLKPKVETGGSTTTPREWRVTDRVRSNADIITQVGGGPVYGGTPSDLSVRQAMQEIKARGMRAMFYPFTLMDMTGYPWRGRITGDATNYMGTAVPAHFGAWDGTSVPYSGPSEWTHRRMILHYARLLSDILVSGDVFIVGSEMVGLSTSDSSWGTKLAALMADVRSMLPAGVLVSYAADWSEYKAASLAPAWSSADFIGLDNYLPLTDWYDGDEIYNRDVFKAGIEGGEYWDYYYADDAARAAGIQSPITDPQYRQKDFRYWRNANHPGKPIWFTEFGCPAIDKGANQPNVFYDPKSVESFFPYRSNGDRNDTVQRLYLEAMIEYWAADGLVDPANMFVWTWDARPYPAFPSRNDVWSDGPNWERGHWLTGRLGTMTLGRLVKILMLDAGFTEADFDVQELENAGIQIVGMGVFQVISTRGILENLMETYSFDCVDSSGVFRFVLRDKPDTITIDPDDLVLDGDGSFTKTVTQDTDLPDRTSVSFRDEMRDYESASVDGHTITGYSRRVDTFDTYCALPVEYARDLADLLTQTAWVRRNAISFTLPMNYLRIENGDVFDFTHDGISRTYRVESITIGDQIEIEAVGHSTAASSVNRFHASVPTGGSVPVFGIPYVEFCDLPVPDDSAPNLWSPRVLVAQKPWPGGILIYEDDSAGGYVFNSRQSVPAIFGASTTDLPAGITDVWDDTSTVTIRLADPAESLASTTDAAVLNGANTMAIKTPSGEWEVFQFQTATLNVDGTYTLSRLLRGLLGTEPFIGNPTPAGSLVVVYDQDRFGVLEGSDARFGLLFNGRYGADGIDVSDNRCVNFSLTARGIPYRPYSPVHLEQSNIGGDIHLSWIRRARFDGDPWVDGEIPLGEDSEKYEVVITGGRTVIVANATTLVYTLAQQIADFGVGQPNVVWSVAQISDRFGVGPATQG